MNISELMTPDPITVQETDKIEDVVKLLNKHHIGGAPVVDKAGTLTGVVSLTDVSKQGNSKETDYYLNPSWGTLHLGKEFFDKIYISEIMTHLAICAKETDDIERAADLMVCHGIHRVIVTKDDQVTGVITSSDLVREFRDRMFASKQLR